MNPEKEYFYEVYAKNADPGMNDVCEEIKDLGVEGVDGVYTGNLFYLYGDLGENRDETGDRIGRELLTDGIIEEYSVRKRDIKGAEIIISFKEGVLDITAVRVLEALKIMGISGIVRVKTARRYVLLNAGRVTAAESGYIAEKLLYNKVIERAEIDAG